MKLRPKTSYSGAQYPCLADYLSEHRKARVVTTVRLTVALGMAAVLLSGCSSIS